MEKPVTMVVGLAVLLLGLSVAGCGKKQPAKLAVYEVTGKLLVNGQPAEGAEIYFHPSNSIDGLSSVPVTRTEADGSFAAGTYAQHDGLPSGEYLLTALWPTRTIVEGEEVVGRDQLNGRFANREKPIARITVAEMPLTVPTIELKQ